MAVSGLEALEIEGVTLWWASTPPATGGYTAPGGKGTAIVSSAISGILQYLGFDAFQGHALLERGELSYINENIRGRGGTGASFEVDIEPSASTSVF